MSFELHQIPVFQDNYVYIVREPASGTVAVIDPGDAAPVIEWLEQHGWTPSLVLNTHHHFDHVGGNQALKDRFGCKIIGPAAEADKIPTLDETVEEGDMVEIGEARGHVFATPGHTLGHICYHFAQQHTLFCGDTLFSLGCGRLFEGDAEQMAAGLNKLRALPDETLVCCAHEYTQANADFALSIDPQNEALVTRAAEIKRQRAAGQPTVPSRLGEEKIVNPFLRWDDPALSAHLGCGDMAPWKCFAEIRRLKDAF